MSFKKLHIRYQTARSLPAPYAYFYTLALTPVANNAIQVDLAITYPDRDDIDDDELIAEGYTRDDDFTWAGQLPKPWLETIQNLVGKTRLQPLNEDELDEDDDFWDMTLEADERKQGKPMKPDDWQYIIQELIQATYEATGRERPFELTYLNFAGPQGAIELRLTASFAKRSVNVVSIQNRSEQTKTLPWSILQHVMSAVYNHDYDPDDAQLKRPQRDGQWLNLGTEEWYDVSPFKDLTKTLKNLQ
ncbi:hypothetical protein [Spirosoma endophyticum]|uniref:Uncharacterized protein n=1 Tax=Spirosoma endophyticum TaxID=662367 RepID=A0A1I1W2C5_9BACT|nr:hypothetical protein [Spirosoma endophyticum]SFD89446.1 hypothetical protein SAMN05216167_108109 [Spirosoma endophyticum]